MHEEAHTAFQLWSCWFWSVLIPDIPFGDSFPAMQLSFGLLDEAHSAPNCLSPFLVLSVVSAFRLLSHCSLYPLRFVQHIIMHTNYNFADCLTSHERSSRGFRYSMVRLFCKPFNRNWCDLKASQPFMQWLDESSGHRDWIKHSLELPPTSPVAEPRSTPQLQNRAAFWSSHLKRENAS